MICLSICLIVYMSVYLSIRMHACIHVYMQTCNFHPGGPVFHEGYKYWSCCKKKRTTEFSEFMGFPGCTKGTCVFTEDPTKKKKALCRYDFFQQGTTVTLSIYAKKVDPEQCKVCMCFSANRQTDTQTDRQTDRQKDRRTDR